MKQAWSAEEDDGESQKRCKLIRKWAAQCSHCLRVQRSAFKKKPPLLAVETSSADGADGAAAGTEDTVMCDAEMQSPEPAFETLVPSSAVPPAGGRRALRRASESTTILSVTISGPGLRPRHRAKSCRARARAKKKLVESMDEAEALFKKADVEHNGYIDLKELSKLMTQVNGGVSAKGSEVALVNRRASQDADGAPLPHAHPNRTYVGEQFRQAISSWRYDGYTSDFITPRIDNASRDNPNSFNVDELVALVTDLNDGVPPTDSELQWLLGNVAAAAGSAHDSAQLDLAMPASAVHTAVGAWYPAEGGGKKRRRPPLVERAVAGIARRTIASQLEMNRHVTQDALVKLLGQLRANQLLQPAESKQAYEDGMMMSCTICREELHSFMVQLNGGMHVSKAAVDYVLLISDVHDPTQISPAQIKDALAYWRTLRLQQEEIDAHFDRYDKDGNGVLQRDEVKHLLDDLNEGIPVSSAEVSWAIHSADMDNSGTLNREELRAAVSWWYLHVAKSKLRVTDGWRMLTPWILASLVGALCALFVALVSVKFSPEITQAWLMTTVLGLVWKLLIFDPIKALCCATLIDPLVGLLCCEFGADALLEVSEEMVETYTEEFTGTGRQNLGKEEAAELARRVAIAAGNNAMFAQQSSVVARFITKFGERRRLKGLASIAEDTAKMNRQQQTLKANSNAKYSDIVAARRRMRGLTMGHFARRSKQQEEEERVRQQDEEDAGAFAASTQVELEDIAEQPSLQVELQRDRYACSLSPSDAPTLCLPDIPRV